jgi:hypothetical protein
MLETTSIMRWYSLLCFQVIVGAMDHDTSTSVSANGQVSAANNLFEWIIGTLDESVLRIHDLLPTPVREILAKFVFVEDISDAILCTIIIGLITVAFIQLKAFTRPKPVSLKQLPTRPIVTISFQPDDISNETMKQLAQAAGASTGTRTVTGTTQAETTTTGSSVSSRFGSGGGFIHKFSFQSDNRKQTNRKDLTTDNKHSDSQIEEEDVVEKEMEKNVVDRAIENVLNQLYSHFDDDDDDSSFDRSDRSPKVGDFASYPFSRVNSSATPGTTAKSTKNVNDLLPDSFAPLLSSSVVDVITEKLTADLIHAISASATVKLRPGIHEIPLDKDSSRPQLRFEVPITGCKVAAAGHVGSDGLTVEQDFNCTTTKNFTKTDYKAQQKKMGNTATVNENSYNNNDNDKGRSGSRTNEVFRSKPMVKSGGIVFDPPIPLSNVAPTLIHFPTLFEDLQYLPILRGIQIVRYFIDFIISISNFLEKCLWIIETKCKIHLSQIRIRPLYKGSNRQFSKNKEEDLPEWRLSLSFSGHVMLFGFVPIPFVNIVLPTVIIPHPHALLEFLLTK